MAITRAWNELTPTRNDNPGAFHLDLRKARQDIREQLDDGHHLVDQTDPPTLGARHVTTDPDSEFPIYSADGVTKQHGFSQNYRAFGYPLRGKGWQEYRYNADAVPNTLPTYIATLSAQARTNYFIQQYWAIWDVDTTNYLGAVQYWYVSFDAGGNLLQATQAGSGLATALPTTAEIVCIANSTAANQLDFGVFILSPDITTMNIALYLRVLGATA